MKNFDEILAEVARQNGTTPENVLHEMQLAIDDAYDHHGKESQPAYTAPRVQYDRRRWCTGSARMVHPFR